MKFTVLQENLARGLSIVSKAVSVKAPLPILENILITAQKGELILASTDLKLGIITKVGAKVEKEGSLAVPARVFSDLVGTLPKVTLDLFEEAKVLHIKTPQTTSRINGLASEEFPKFMPLAPKPFLEINSKVFSEAVGKTAFAAAGDDGRPILTGLLLKTAGKSGVLVGVDGFRLAEYRFELKSAASWQGVIPVKAMVEVARLFAGGEGPIKAYDQTDSGEVVFEKEATQIYTKLLEGEFPDYKKIIPKELKTTVEASLEELLQSIKTVSVFAALESGGVLKLKADEASGTIELSALAGEVGENKTVLDAKVEGEPVTIAFNNKYLSDYLSNAKQEGVTLAFNGSLSPAKFKSPKQPHYTYIVMPVRVQS
ncbi:MAG: DNA polymerase III subunit beta [bacterium]